MSRSQTRALLLLLLLTETATANRRTVSLGMGNLHLGTWASQDTATVADLVDRCSSCSKEVPIRI